MPARARWTTARQLVFLDALAWTRSVTAAARAAGMSRESAYRLRARDPHGLFAALWNRAFTLASLREEPSPTPAKGHSAPLTDGRAMRLLGNAYRRQSATFRAAAPSAP